MFGGRLARVDLLVLDDLQFLTGRREMQSELLRLFTSMQQENRQIICASDRPPGEIADVDERLIGRLAGGLVCDVGVPEYEARVAILRAACAERELSVPDSTILGLMSTSGGGDSSPTSTTATRRATPTWFAASPTPCAARMVSNRSSTSWRTASSTRATGSARWRRTGEPSRCRARTVTPAWPRRPAAA